MAVIGLDAHQDVNRGHDESLNDQRMFDELRATLSAGGPPQSQLGSVSERGRAGQAAGAPAVESVSIGEPSPNTPSSDDTPPAAFSPKRQRLCAPGPRRQHRRSPLATPGRLTVRSPSDASLPALCAPRLRDGGTPASPRGLAA